MKIRWNEVAELKQQDFDPKATLENIVLTIRKVGGPILEVCQTVSTVHPDGDVNLEILVR
jgi:hypothetical protein